MVSSLVLFVMPNVAAEERGLSGPATHMMHTPYSILWGQGTVRIWTTAYYEASELIPISFESSIICRDPMEHLGCITSRSPVN